MKKGQGQLVAFVLLVGFTIVIGIMVGNWMIKQSRKMGESAAGRTEIDARCADAGIALVCEGTVPKIKNTGYFTIKLGKGGNELKPGDLSQPLRMGETVIPFIEIEGKEYGCSNKAVTLDCSTQDE